MLLGYTPKREARSEGETLFSSITFSIITPICTNIAKPHPDSLWLPPFSPWERVRG